MNQEADKPRLLLVDDDEMVRDYVHPEVGPLRLVGRVKWLIDPDFRGIGLGATLVNLLMHAAHERGLRHLTCMLISDIEQDAIEVLTELGFQEHRVAGYGADPDGNRHDMSLLIFRFGEKAKD